MAVAQLRSLRICRTLPLTEDSPPRDEIPRFAHIFLIESCGLLCAEQRCVRRPGARKKGGPASGEKLEPRRRCNTDRLNTIDEAACCASVFHSTPQLFHHSKDSLQARFISGFLSGHLNRIERSCAVAISAPDQTCGSRSGEVRSSAALSKRAESHRNKTIARPVS
jgi:hypothetical protein